MQTEGMVQFFYSGQKMIWTSELLLLQLLFSPITKEELRGTDVTIMICESICPFRDSQKSRSIVLSLSETFPCARKRSTLELSARPDLRETSVKCPDQPDASIFCRRNNFPFKQLAV
jgi:hypothetical protein